MTTARASLLLVLVSALGCRDIPTAAAFHSPLGATDGPVDNDVFSGTDTGAADAVDATDGLDGVLFDVPVTDDNDVSSVSEAAGDGADDAEFAAPGDDATPQDGIPFDSSTGGDATLDVPATELPELEVGDGASKDGAGGDGGSATADADVTKDLGPADVPTKDTDTVADGGKDLDAGPDGDVAPAVDAAQDFDAAPGFDAADVAAGSGPDSSSDTDTGPPSDGTVSCPGVAETCNGLDDDCDGLTDEQCGPCTLSVLADFTTGYGTKAGFVLGNGWRTSTAIGFYGVPWAIAYSNDPANGYKSGGGSATGTLPIAAAAQYVQVTVPAFNNVLDCDGSDLNCVPMLIDTTISLTLVVAGAGSAKLGPFSKSQYYAPSKVLKVVLPSGWLGGATPVTLTIANAKNSYSYLGGIAVSKIEVCQ